MLFIKPKAHTQAIISNIYYHNNKTFNTKNKVKSQIKVLLKKVVV